MFAPFRFFSARAALFALMALGGALSCVAHAQKAKAPRSKTASSQTLAAPARFDWIGVWGRDERVYLVLQPAPHLVYLSKIETGKAASEGLPAYIEITLRVPGALYGARFRPKKWGGRVELPLARLQTTDEIEALDRANPRGGPAALVLRQWTGALGGGNVSEFRLFPDPKTLPSFRARGVYRARAGGNPRLGSFAPTLRIKGSSAILDARRYDDQINAPIDVGILLDLPQGRAFGLVLGARLGDKPLVIPLHSLGGKATKTPSAVVGFNGNFNPDPDLMGPEAFGFALKADGATGKRGP